MYSGTYLQSAVPGNTITMTYYFDNSDSNVGNIPISADLSDCYTST